MPWLAHGTQTQMHAYRTSEQATKAMWKALNGIDAVWTTRDAIAKARHSYELGLRELHELATKVESKKTAA
jgi:hypothetical protein